MAKMSTSLYGFLLPHCLPSSPSSSPSRNNPVSARFQFHTLRCRFPKGLQARASPGTRATRPQITDPQPQGPRLAKLLEMSVKAGNFGVAVHCLEHLLSTGHTLNIFHCNKLIHGLHSSNQVDKAVQVLGMLEARGLPNVVNYNTLIAGLCKAGRLESAFEVVLRMTSRGCPPNDVTRNILIDALCSRGKLDMALHRSVEDKFPADDFIRTVLVEAAALQGGTGDAMKLFDEMVSQGLVPASYTYGAIIRGMCEEGKVDAAVDFLRSLPSRGCDPNVVCYNIILHALRSRWEDAQKLIAEMHERGLKPDNVTYTCLIRSLCEAGAVDRAAQLVKHLTKRKMKVSFHFYGPVITAYCKDGQAEPAMELADFLLSHGQPPDIVCYNKILTAFCRSGKAEVHRALQILYELPERGCSPDTISYNAIMTRLWSIGNATGALGLVLEMLDRGNEPNVVTYHILITGLSRHGMINEAISLLKDMESTRFKPGVRIYNNILRQLCRVHKIDMAIDLLAEMVHKGLCPCETTYIILLYGIAFAGHPAEAVELASYLVGRNVLSPQFPDQLESKF